MHTQVWPETASGWKIYFFSLHYKVPAMVEAGNPCLLMMTD